MSKYLFFVFVFLVFDIYFVKIDYYFSLLNCLGHWVFYICLFFRDFCDFISDPNPNFN
jgi:hypothetical protein